MNVNRYFTHYEYPGKGGKIYIVVEHYSSGKQKTIGVVTGLESVCVINAGMGMSGDLRKYVEDMLGTDKTVECVALTGRPEDTGSLALFDKAYLEPREMDTWREHGRSEEERKALFAELSAGNPESISYGEALYIDNSEVSFYPAGHGIGRMRAAAPGPHMYDNSGDGYMFHLGGTVVEMAELPAQSDGQLAAVSPTCCISFTGDALEPITHLESRDRASLQRYADCLKQIIDYVNAPTRYAEGLGRTPHIFYCSSSSVPMRMQDAEAVLQACLEVLAGETGSDIPAGSVPTQRLHLVNNCGIVYDTAKLG